jgi:hypothetical protein
MNEKTPTLLRSILKKDSLHDCSIEELQKLAGEYPYFSPAQFLLVQKLKKTNKELYEEQLQKLALHFSNPLWLNHILNEDNPHMITEENQIRDEAKTTDAGLPAEDTNQQPVAGELTFEPYHTVDYFASQGIKPVQEEKPTDKFGQQLKSFTEWLKMMKRLPAAEMEKKVDVTSEAEVVQLAETSLKDDEIVTEAMADVWIKQGNREKAIEIYHKLSLHNPSKSDYFAAKIGEIKNSLT